MPEGELFHSNITRKSIDPPGQSRENGGWKRCQGWGHRDVAGRDTPNCPGTQSQQKGTTEPREGLDQGKDGEGGNAGIQRG